MSEDERELLAKLKTTLMITRASITTTANDLIDLRYGTSTFVTASYMLQAANNLSAAIQQIDVEIRE